MLYTGIDYHRKYSVLRTVDVSGTRVKGARLEHEDGTAFASYFAGLPEESRVVLEACWNWGWLYDQLGELKGVNEVVLANPYKTRMIGDAQIKNDKVDAEALATLLRGNLIATAYAPSPATRARKHVIRQRMFWVRQRTMVRCRRRTKGGRLRLPRFDGQSFGATPTVPFPDPPRCKRAAPAISPRATPRSPS